jgi:hypothetical protein
MGRADQRSAALTDTFMSAYVTSSSDGTKWQDVAHTGSWRLCFYPKWLTHG